MPLPSILVIFGVRKRLSDIDSTRTKIDARNKAVLVSADIENVAPSHTIGTGIGFPNVGKPLPGHALYCLMPLLQGRFRRWMPIPKRLEFCVAEDIHIVGTARYSILHHVSMCIIFALCEDVKTDLKGAQEKQL